MTRGVAAANRAVELSLIQYREGAADYTTVLTSQQSKLREDDSLTTSRGSVTLSAIALYKALGGGWELREGGDFVPEDVRQEMRARGGAACWTPRRRPTASRSGRRHRRRHTPRLSPMAPLVAHVVAARV